MSIIPSTAKYGGENIMFEIKDKYVVIYADLSKNLGQSKSGKSFVIASTRGATTVDEGKGIKLNLNLYQNVNNAA